MTSEAIKASIDEELDAYDPERHGGLYGIRRVKAMAAVLIALLLSILDYAVANVALPVIATDLHSSPSLAIWVVNAYQLANLSCLLPLAALGARIGFARMSQIGIILFIIASTFCALSQNMLGLTLARALQGIGGSCIMSVNIALVRFIYPHKLLGKGIAINGIFVGLGVAVGPSLGSLILSISSWPWIFWINLPLGGIAFFLSRRSLPATPCSPVKIDFVGSLLTISSFALTGIGVDGLMHGDWLIGGVLSGVSIISWVALLKWQKGRAEPVLPLDLLNRRPFFLACLVSFLGFVSSNLYIVAMPFTLATTFHRNAETVGLLIAPWAVGVAFMSFIVGRFSDRFSASILSCCGLLTTSVGFFLLCQLSVESSDQAIIWRTLLAGMGFGLFQPPNNRAIMITAPAGREGGASGMLSVARLSGQTTGALLVAGAFTVFTHPSFICLTAACVIAFMGALLSIGRSLFNQRHA